MQNPNYRNLFFLFWFNIFSCCFHGNPTIYAFTDGQRLLYFDVICWMISATFTFLSQLLLTIQRIRISLLLSNRIFISAVYTNMESECVNLLTSNYNFTLHHAQWFGGKQGPNKRLLWLWLSGSLVLRSKPMATLGRRAVGGQSFFLM